MFLWPWKHRFGCFWLVFFWFLALSLVAKRCRTSLFTIFTIFWGDSQLVFEKSGGYLLRSCWLPRDWSTKQIQDTESLNLPPKESGGNVSWTSIWIEPPLFFFRLGLGLVLSLNLHSLHRTSQVLRLHEFQPNTNGDDSHSRVTIGCKKCNNFGIC